MNQINLSFDFVEKELFLIKRGYIIETVQTYKMVTVYHNQAEAQKFTLQVAYHERPEEWISEPNFYSYFGHTVDVVFLKELKKALLQL